MWQFLQRARLAISLPILRALDWVLGLKFQRLGRVSFILTSTAHPNLDSPSRQLSIVTLYALGVPPQLVLSANLLRSRSQITTQPRSSGRISWYFPPQAFNMNWSGLFGQAKLYIFGLQGAHILDLQFARRQTS